MGLGVNVCMLADMRQNDEEGLEYYREAFDALSRFLASEGYAGFEEPELPRPKTPAHVGSFPYSFLHYLRRAFAHGRKFERVTPCAPGERPTDDPLLDEEYSVMMDSHLCCHSDTEGYYVPIDFPAALYPDDSLGIAGGIVGSSYGLLRELVSLAPQIGITLNSQGKPGDDELSRLSAISDDTGGLWVEQLVWLTLFVHAQASIETGSCIVFS